MAGFRVGGAARVIGDRIVRVALDHVAQRSDVDGACARSIGFDLRDIASRRRARLPPLSHPAERQRRREREDAQAEHAGTLEHHLHFVSTSPRKNHARHGYNAFA